MWAKARAVGNVYPRCPRAVPVRASASSTCPPPAFASAGVVLLLGGRRRLPVTDGRCCAGAARRRWARPVLRKLVDLSLSFEEVGPRGGHPGGPDAGAASFRDGAYRRGLRYPRSVARGKAIALPIAARGGCGFSSHGAYERKCPAGTLIARWYCPQGHRTFSLLPDHLAARFPGTLSEIEHVVEARGHAGEQQARQRRCAAITLASALALGAPAAGAGAALLTSGGVAAAAAGLLRRGARICARGFPAVVLMNCAPWRRRICRCWARRVRPPLSLAVSTRASNNTWGLTEACDSAATPQPFGVPDMTDAHYRQALALFRYGLIAEFVQLPAGSRGLYRRLREKANTDYTIPGSTRTRVAPETLRHWLKDYRRGGFDALIPKGRADRGRSRALPQAVADALMSLKDEQPHLSIPQLIRAVQQNGAAPESLALPPSTVHRLLSRAGLMHKARVRTKRAARTGAASPSRTPANCG